MTRRSARRLSSARSSRRSRSRARRRRWCRSRRRGPRSVPIFAQLAARMLRPNQSHSPRAAGPDVLQVAGALGLGVCSSRWLCPGWQAGSRPDVRRSCSTEAKELHAGAAAALGEAAAVERDALSLTAEAVVEETGLAAPYTGTRSRPWP